VAVEKAAIGKESTRLRILEAAQQVFAEKGYHGAIVDDIVRTSATSKGAFYFYFPNKEAIFLALVDKLADRLAREVEDSIAKERGGLAKTDGALRTVLDLFSRHQSLAKILLVDVVGLGHAFDKKMMETRSRFAAIIQKHLDKAVAEGAISAIDTKLVSLMWLGAINEVIIHWLYSEQLEPLEHALPTLRKVLLRSINALQEDNS